MLENTTSLKPALFWFINPKVFFDSWSLQSFWILTPEDGTDMSSRNVGKKLPFPWVTPQKSAVLIYLAAEACNHCLCHYYSPAFSSCDKRLSTCFSLQLFTFTAPKLTIMANKTQHPYTRGLCYTFVYLSTFLPWIYFPSLEYQEAIYSPRWLWMGPTLPTGFVTAYCVSSARLWTARPTVLVLHSQISISSDPVRKT